MEYKINENLIELIIDKKVVGNVMLGKQADNIYRILRVFVDESQRGKGLAGKLVEKCVENAKEKGHKLIPVCSFAVREFKQKKEYEDVWLK